MIEKQDIKRYLPHREPFLFVDGVTEIIKDEYIKGFKEVKEDEYYFKGHFPDNPILPGVIIIEALACLLYTSPSPRDGIGSRMPSSA